jgi:hypothetical protein
MLRIHTSEYDNTPSSIVLQLYTALSGEIERIHRADFLIDFGTESASCTLLQTQPEPNTFT